MSAIGSMILSGVIGFAVGGLSGWAIRDFQKGNNKSAQELLDEADEDEEELEEKELEEEDESE